MRNRNTIIPHNIQQCRSGSAIRSIHAITGSKMRKYLRLCASFGIIQDMNLRHSLRRLESSSCSSILYNPNCERSVVLIGTAHVSEKSVNQVRQSIRSLEAVDRVMIEIDRSRLKKITSSNPTFGEATFVEPSIDLSALINNYHQPRQLYESIIQPRTRPNGLFQSALTTMVLGITFMTKPLWVHLLKRSLFRIYKDVYRKTGIKAGGEITAAIEEATKLKVPIVLGDRHVDETIHRLFESLMATLSKSK